jgi:hypothetical protein
MFTMPFGRCASKLSEECRSRASRVSCPVSFFDDLLPLFAQELADLARLPLAGKSRSSNSGTDGALPMDYIWRALILAAAIGAGGQAPPTAD